MKIFNFESLEFCIFFFYLNKSVNLRNYFLKFKVDFLVSNVNYLFLL